MSYTPELNTIPIKDLSLNERISSMELSDLNLPARISHRLERQGKSTFWALLQTTRDELLAMPNIGPKSLVEVLLAVERGLAALGIDKVNGKFVVQRLNGSAVQLHHGRSNDPSPAYIAENCAQIRDGWSEAELGKRGGAGSKERWLPPFVNTPDDINPPK